MEGWGYHHIQATGPAPKRAPPSFAGEGTVNKAPDPAASAHRIHRTPKQSPPVLPAAASSKHSSISSESAIANRGRLRSDSSISNITSRYASIDHMSNPFIHRYGRRFLRDPTLNYPLPTDLVELHRQVLRTLTLMRVLGAPFCCPFFEDSPPQKVLEICCGSALWSSACHDYFKQQGHPNVSFTGIDIAPVAPDLNQNGLNWKFVQHDMRKLPLPFSDGEFDFIFAKDIDLCFPAPDFKHSPTTEPLRLLKSGGVLELWASDHVIRTLLPYPSIPAGASEDEIEQAEETATYVISPSTAFAEVQNTYLSDYNSWVQKALEKRKLTSLPCGIANWAFLAEPDKLGDVGSRRVAIPFGEMRWEGEIGGTLARGKSQGRNQKAIKAEKQPSVEPKVLTPGQTALRRTALKTTIDFIESLELILKAESGKRQDEWDRWWAGMTHNLLESNGTFNGECLEIGVWWGRKK